MASEVPKPPAIGIFKPSRYERERAKAGRGAEKRADREGNDEKHLAAIRKCPCAIPGCNKVGVDPHHLKCVPGNRGMGLRAPDRLAIPLCRFPHHEEAEKRGPRGEYAWFMSLGLDPIALADALFNCPHRGNAAAYTAIVLANKGVHRKPVGGA